MSHTLELNYYISSSGTNSIVSTYNNQTMATPLFNYLKQPLTI